MNPFARTKVKHKADKLHRVRDMCDGHPRERLHGAAKERRRREIFERSGGFCEEMVDAGPQHYWLAVGDKVRCFKPITWDNFHWSHNRHGSAWKCDHKNCGLASCEGHHRNKHNAGGRPCPRRPGRVMNLTEARKYWQGETCYCAGPKKSQESFCAACTLRLSPQVRRDLENTDSPRDYCAAVAAAEIELLTK